MNCVAQRVCWGREKVGQKGVAAGGRVREGEGEDLGRAESGGKRRKSDPAANSPGEGSAEAGDFWPLFVTFWPFSADR